MTDAEQQPAPVGLASPIPTAREKNIAIPPTLASRAKIDVCAVASLVSAVAGLSYMPLMILALALGVAALRRRRAGGNLALAGVLLAAIYLGIVIFAVEAATEFLAAVALAVVRVAHGG